MSYRPKIANVTKAGSNDKEGLYEFIVSLADGTQCRVFYNRFPDWEMTALTRLGKVPCPVCHKDFICKCMEKFQDDFDRQLKEQEWLSKVAE
ncbi:MULTISPECIES: hypothetical protein [Paenibacillus]|uniref:Uncharacterized protein n=1 Tax=Paenibacillus campinasensis TaxID=66347 RepID=A0A268EWZ8_9BACL|nr:MULTISPECIES: hypothetical protein [Paenibacillus]MUG68315.1 hypothetical protein [Paenibacillus campinasensis]PAD77594.1 hypothetical protein CHH67_09000 [Paenibacillus campinasensis]PAK49735.1 hypothetical protein CHH75_19325 [Paenibacillus sp. 7541]